MWVFANLHTFRGLVANVSLKQPADAREAGRVFMCNFGLKLFRPVALASLACPLTEKHWHLCSRALDFRAAQYEQDMAPRDGPWFSNHEVALQGAMTLTSPIEANTLGLPTEIFVTMRASWAPAHCAIRFENDEAIQKISFRRWHGEATHWKTGTYDSSVFTRARKLAAPLAFFTPGEIPGDAAYAEFTTTPSPITSDAGANEDDSKIGTTGATGTTGIIGSKTGVAIGTRIGISLLNGALTLPTATLTPRPARNRHRHLRRNRRNLPRNHQFIPNP